MNKKYLSIILVVMWMIIIFIMSSCNATTSDSQSRVIVDIVTTVTHTNMNIDTITYIVRKNAHFMEYLILGLLLCNCNKYYRKPVYFIVLFCFIYAASDEFHQLFVFGRSSQFIDILIDTCGSIGGVIIYYIIKRLFSLKKCKLK